MEEKELITSVEYNTPFYDCDHKNRLKMSSFLKLTAELAGKDYTDKGMSHEFLWEHGFVFLLSKISLGIKRYPSDGEKLKISTWEAGRKGAMFLRGYVIEGEDGEVCAEGISGWILVNPETRKIIRPADFPWQMPRLETKILSALPVGKIQAESPELAGEHIVRFPDLDCNGHVYNGNYADIASECMSKELYEKDVKNFRINFTNEAKLGDRIQLLLEEKENRAVILGIVDGKPCFECEYVF